MDDHALQSANAVIAAILKIMMKWENKLDHKSLPEIQLLLNQKF